MRSVHLIGVCGTAMATLAVLLKARGLSVTGSDEHVYPPMSDLLAREGIAVREGYRSEHVPEDVDLVVIGNAVSRGNPEVEAVLDRRTRYASLPEVLRNELLWDRRPFVVAGTHGKTTTTSMLAWILSAAGHDPSFLVGGISRNLGTSGRLGRGDAFVLEGDEYDSAFFDKTAKFLKYRPEVAIVNNLEFDHADIYRDLDELRVAFRRLVALVPRSGRLLVCADDPEAAALAADAPCPVWSFGLTAGASWRAVEIEHRAEGTAFTVEHDGTERARVELPLLGDFNVRNALGALAAAVTAGVGPGEAAGALARFEGVKRRLELRGTSGGVAVYDDFAHHPTAVGATLDALRAIEGGGRLWAVFEPRSATACRRIFQDAFVAALAGADRVVVAAVYRSSLPEPERLSEAQVVAGLTQAGTWARFVPTVDEIVTMVAAEAEPGDRVVIMSNGAFGGIHDRLLAALG